MYPHYEQCWPHLVQSFCEIVDGIHTHAQYHFDISFVEGDFARLLDLQERHQDMYVVPLFMVWTHLPSVPLVALLRLLICWHHFSFFKIGMRRCLPHNASMSATFGITQWPGSGQ
jgi:hypothetical protein